MTVTNVAEIEKGLWKFKMPPHQIRLFGEPKSNVGERSILIFSDFIFDPIEKKIHFEADAVTALNVGTLADVLGMSATSELDAKSNQGSNARTSQDDFGSGDRRFLEMVKAELPPHMQEASLLLLKEIRARSSGDLKKGMSRNFSDTPDNFWYVIVQPRIEQLSITVRGPVGHFENLANLPIKDDRGNTLFKVTGPEDVPAAVEIIFHAIRKS
ncbi:MAG: hypothetical protein COB40_01870 [Marinosulfonomonas sp.]|nr:MAG: hypothetical protein COB40_08835 [Marinosulfonomonas sp.]PHQ98023.1 MAG: hypothetical protein COB40_01870 [Marinosulfonomonas sp.]